VPAGLFTFTGTVTTGFPDYRDTATGRMLVAEPGHSYGIEAINLTDAVPPGSLWVPASGDYSGSGGAPPGPPPPVPPVPEVPSVNDQEGGE
jgi:hypothetical protein